jgi:hypothetical protein
MNSVMFKAFHYAICKINDCRFSVMHPMQGQGNINTLYEWTLF